jgi:3-oxoacyl-[acyl-carrier protein] reductase
VVSYRHNQKRAEAVAAEVKRVGGDSCVVFLDLASPDSITKAMMEIEQRWGRLDILVNNAVQWAESAEAHAVPFMDSAAEGWRELLHANIDGTLMLIHRALDGMKRSGWGRIVNVSSIAADDGLPGAVWYASAKAALHGFTRSISQEVGPAGILCNVVMPGLTRTERVIATMPDTVLEGHARRTAIGRVLDPEDVASAIVFLCSQANTGITGEVVRVSGGRTP